MVENYIDHWNANGQMYDIQDAGRGLPNGVATLDLTGRVPYSQLPESAVEFKGYWNASTNTPTLADGTGTKGDMYYVDVAGTRDLGSGTQRFYVGDRVLYDGSVWKNMNPDLIDLFLPVGHLIWTGNANFNPNTQYPGTTWAQIKDKFILAAGDTYTNGATGGSATVTLTVDQVPSHDHSFTPSGSVSVTSNPAFSGIAGTTGDSSANNTGSESSHTHGLSGTFTTGNCIETGSTTAITQIGGMSANESHSHTIPSTDNYSGANMSEYASNADHLGRTKTLTNISSTSVAHTHNMEHRHQVTLSGNTGSGSSHSHTMWHTHQFTPVGSISGGAYKFTGTAGTTGAKGGGQAHNNMPPYIVKYCWERTA